MSETKLVPRKIPRHFLGNIISKIGNSGFGNILNGFAGGGIQPNMLPQQGELANGAISGATKKAIGQQALGGMAAGVLGGINAFADINNSDMNSAQKSMARADAGVQAVSNIAGAFGPVGSAIGAGLNVINTLGGKLVKTPKEVKDFAVNETVGASSSFGGVNADAGSAMGSANSFKTAGLAGKLFGKKKVKNQIAQSNATQNQASQILNTNKTAMDIATSSADMFNARNTNKLNQGNMFTDGSVQFGREGLKIKNTRLDDYRNMCKASKQINVKRITKKLTPANLVDKNAVVTVEVLPAELQVGAFKDGGVIESKNIIVEGALHAHKHNIKDNEEFADASITLKGIPVVTKEEDGGIIQHAEIEREELILHYDLSKKLERLQEDGSEEAMIEAGRLLAEELLKNTIDKSKLIKQTDDN